ncbi:MAG: 2OG-Fe(II) oxygenase [Gammaproteobacteria bacterium]|nr:2OG-Fe(II) oxygenase [Gammaproteobacteria bacterium]
MSRFNPQGYYDGGLTTPAAQRVLDDVPPGNYQQLGVLPPGLLVVENLLSPADCQKIVEFAATQPAQASTVQANGADARAVTPSHARITDYIAPGRLQRPVVELVSNVFRNIAGRHFDATIEWFEQPEILRYRPGGLYKTHADAENWNTEQQAWEKRVDRDLSLLIYLNDDFTGGQLDFPNFGLRLQPKAGMLVAFPADHRYVHAALPTSTGERYVVVSWAATRGSRRVGDGPPPGAIVVNEP